MSLVFVRGLFSEFRAFFIVGNKEHWKNDQHPLRKNNIYNLTAIPTLLFVKDNYPLIKLTEGDLVDENFLEEFKGELIN